MLVCGKIDFQLKHCTAKKEGDTNSILKKQSIIRVTVQTTSSGIDFQRHS